MDRSIARVTGRRDFNSFADYFGDVTIGRSTDKYIPPRLDCSIRGSDMSAGPVSSAVSTAPLSRPAAFSCLAIISHIFISGDERTTAHAVSSENAGPLVNSSWRPFWLHLRCLVVLDHREGLDPDAQFAEAA